MDIDHKLNIKVKREMGKKFNLTVEQFINLRHSIKWWLLNYNTTHTHNKLMCPLWYKHSKNKTCRRVTTSPRILYIYGLDPSRVRVRAIGKRGERNINTFVSCHKTWFHVIYLQISISDSLYICSLCYLYFIIIFFITHTQKFLSYRSRLIGEFFMFVCLALFNY